MLWVFHSWEGLDRFGKGYNGGKRSRGDQRAGLVQQGFGRGREPFLCLCSFVHPFSSSTMPGLWLRPGSGGDRRWFPTVASAVAHLKKKGTAIWPTQVSRAAQQGSTRNSWCFRSTDPNAANAEEEPPPPPHPCGQRPAAPCHHGGGFLHTHIRTAFLWVLRREAVGRYPYVLGVQSTCPCTLLPPG